MEDEKILLASRWFHCVRVDRGVLKDSHPLNSLFAGARAPHIIVYSADGALRSDLDGKPGARALWGSMNKVLRADYKKSADTAMAKWIALLSRFDALDSRKAELTSQRDESSDGRKTSEIEKKIADLEREVTKAHEDEKKIMDLEFRNPTAAPTAGESDADAADAVAKAKGKSSLLDKVKKDKEKDQSK